MSEYKVALAEVKRRVGVEFEVKEVRGGVAGGFGEEWITVKLGSVGEAEAVVREKKINGNQNPSRKIFNEE